MRSVTLIGRIGGDASVEKSKNGNEFIKFSIATQEYNEKETVWMNVLSFNHDIIRMAQYYKKGTLLCVIGDLKVNKFLNKDNVTVTSLDVVAYSCSFVNSGGNKDNKDNIQQQAETSSSSAITPDQMTTTPNRSESVKPSANDLSNVNTDYDDDLPF